MSANSTAAVVQKKSGMQVMLDGIEKLGNKVPHPVLMFLYLIILIIVLSHIMFLLNVSVTEDIAVPVDQPVELEYYEDTTAPGVISPDSPADLEFEIESRTTAIRSLLTTDGIRFMFSSFVRNFQGFGVVAVTFIAMLGAGAAEGAGMMGALIRKLVQVAPRRLIGFFIVFVGVLSSVASDAGYLILVPLGAAAFASLRRHPLAGMAAAYAGVSIRLTAKMPPTPA